MNDAFVGDIGDYGKYGLLRVLTHQGGFPLGIVWMKTKPTARTRDRPFDYLDTSVKTDESLANCDSKLYRILKPFIDRDNRKIANLEASHALPKGTTYFDKLLDFRGMPANGKKALDGRLLFRKEWFRGALKAVQATELVFFDPDNGLETPSMRRHRASGPKYVWYDELKPFFDRCQSLIVYQHADRAKGRFEAAISRRADELRINLKCQRIWVLRWRRVQSRVYFVIPTTEHDSRMEKAVGSFKESRWCHGEHFSVTDV